jgi:hypothetical protein
MKQRETTTTTTHDLASQRPPKVHKKKLVRFHKYLGPLYTMSQGQCSTQIKHSYWCKSWNQPQGLFTLGVKPEIEKTFSICPKLLIINAELYRLVLVPRLKKKRRIPIEFGKPICNPWSQCSSIYYYPNINVVAFISNLGPHNKPKMLKVLAQVFYPSLLV